MILHIHGSTLQSRSSSFLNPALLFQVLPDSFGVKSISIMISPASTITRSNIIHSWYVHSVFGCIYPRLQSSPPKGSGDEAVTLCHGSVDLMTVPWHRTPASPLWLQPPVLVLYGQPESLVSVPVHRTSVIWIGPEPWPKKALLNATAPAR